MGEHRPDANQTLSTEENEMATEETITTVAARSWEHIMALVPYHLFQSSIVETDEIARFHASAMLTYADSFLRELRERPNGHPEPDPPYTPEQIAEAEELVAAFKKQAEQFEQTFYSRTYVAERRQWKSLIKAFVAMHPNWIECYQAFRQDCYRWKNGDMPVEYDIPEEIVENALEQLRSA
jgi:hypothetical protein